MMQIDKTANLRRDRPHPTSRERVSVCSYVRYGLGRGYGYESMAGYIYMSGCCQANCVVVVIT